MSVEPSESSSISRKKQANYVFFKDAHLFLWRTQIGNALSYIVYGLQPFFVHLIALSNSPNAWYVLYKCILQHVEFIQWINIIVPLQKCPVVIPVVTEITTQNTTGIKVPQEFVW